MSRSSWSLRARVAAASATGALLVVASAGLVLDTVLARQQFAALDRQLTQVSAVVSPVLLAQTRRPGATAAPRARQRLADRVVAVLGASFVGVAYRRGCCCSTLRPADCGRCSRCRVETPLRSRRNLDACQSVVSPPPRELSAAR